MRLVASEVDPVSFHTAMSTMFWRTSTQMSTWAQAIGQRLSAYADATPISPRGITNCTAARSYRPCCGVRSPGTTLSDGRGDLAQERRGVCEARVPREPADVLGGPLAEAAAQRGVPGELPDGGREGVRVARRDHPSVLLVGDELRGPADPRHHHRQAARHRLHDRERHALVVAGQHEEVA